eukprot:scaffold109_cov252-Pinguiococcus_pyrenoidosus.AAC.47
MAKPGAFLGALLVVLSALPQPAASFRLAVKANLAGGHELTTRRAIVRGVSSAMALPLLWTAAGRPANAVTLEELAAEEQQSFRGDFDRIISSFSRAQDLLEKEQYQDVRIVLRFVWEQGELRCRRRTSSP